MKKICTIVALSLFTVVALADPCMDSNVSALGYYETPTADEIHLEEHGC